MKFLHHMNKNSLLVLVAGSVLITTTLIACGGGGGGKDEAASIGGSTDPAGNLAQRCQQTAHRPHLTLKALPFAASKAILYN